MEKFTFYNPTKIYFGENAVENLHKELKNIGKNILITYGGGSIKRNGIYDTIMKILKDENKNVYELSGIMPNPRTEKVYEGIKICKENDIDFILAIGGGSTIDCSKAISAGSKTEKDFWEAFLINNEKCDEAIDIGAVLTLAATGSEMNSGCVITNWDENLKYSYASPLVQPKFSILDPTYTYSLPVEHIAYGTVDIMSHIFEVYFSKPDTSNVSDSIAEALMKNVIENVEVAIQDPKNYTARANLMWDSSLAINGIIKIGKKEDWMSHKIEHALSAFTDITHGAGLAIVHPNYMKYVYKNEPQKFARYAVNIWNVDQENKTVEEIALEGIEKTQEFFKKIGAPTTLKEVSITKDMIDEIAEKTEVYDTSYAKLNTKDIKNILNMCLK